MKSQKKLNCKYHKVMKIIKSYNVSAELIVTSKSKNQINIPSHMNISDERSCTSNLYTPSLLTPTTRIDKVDTYLRKYQHKLVKDFPPPVTYLVTYQYYVSSNIEHRPLSIPSNPLTFHLLLKIIQTINRESNLLLKLNWSIVTYHVKY